MCLWRLSESGLRPCRLPAHPEIPRNRAARDGELWGALDSLLAQTLDTTQAAMTTLAVVALVVSGVESFALSREPCVMSA